MTDSIFQEGPTYADQQHDHVSSISSGNWPKNTYFSKAALSVYFLNQTANTPNENMPFLPPFFLTAEIIFQLLDW